jgi:hypothetical protein
MASLFASLRAVRWSASLALLGIATGCGGAAPAPAQPPPAPPPARSPLVIAAPDLAPVAEPAQLVALVRWKSPAASFASLRDWTGLPIGTSDLLDLISLSDLAGILSDDTSIDAVAALDPAASALADWEPLAAVSMGLKSLQEGRKLAETLGSVTEVGPGAYKLRIGKNSRRHRDKATCLISAAAGQAPARLVCGQRDRDLDALAGYLTRTLPSTDLGQADVHVELRFPPLVQRYGTLMNEGLHVGAAMIPDRLGLGEPTFDRALQKAALGIVDELMAVSGDLDRLTIDAAIHAKTADVTVHVRMRDRQSWTTGSLASMAKRSDVAPPLFWRLPAASTAAGFSFANDPQRVTEIARTLQELLDGYLSHEKVPAADRAAVTDLISPRYAIGAPWVGAASGVDWALWGVAEPAKSREWIQRAMATCQRPKLLALAGKIVAEQTDGEKKTGKAPAPLRCTAVVPSAVLPKGTLDYEITVSSPSRESATKASGTKKKASRSRPTEQKVHLLVASSASETWMALGVDRAKIATALLAVIQQPADSATLAKRDGLDALRSGRLMSGGFITLEMFVRMFERVEADMADSDADVRNGSGIAQILASTPHRGRTPLVFSSSITDGAAVTWTGRYDVPKAFVEDLVVLGATTALKAFDTNPTSRPGRRKP